MPVVLDCYLGPGSVTKVCGILMNLTSSSVNAPCEFRRCIFRYTVMHIMWDDQDQGMLLCLHVLHIHSINFAPQCPVFC